MSDEPKIDAPATTPSNGAEPAPAPAPVEVKSEAKPAEDDAPFVSRAVQWDRDLRARGRYPELAAVLAFLVPGLGHIYLGRPAKGLFAFVILCGLFGWGVGISRGECVSLAGDEESGHRYAFIAQVGAGVPTGLALLHTHQYEVKKALGMQAEMPTPVSDRFTTDEYVERLPKQDEGLLYTMIAGLLNLLLIYDAYLGAPGGALRPKDDAASTPSPAPPANPPPAAPPDPGPGSTPAAPGSG